MSAVTLPIDTTHQCPLCNRVVPGSVMDKLRQTLVLMNPGESFLFTLSHRVEPCFKAAYELGYTIRVRKQLTGGWRVWLISKSTTKRIK